MPLSSKAALSKDLAQSRGNEVFQHRHYAEIARIIRTIRDNKSRERATFAFCEELATRNANFNAQRFLRACEVA